MNNKERLLLNIKLGKILRFHRKKTGLTQGDVAKKLEIHQAAFSRIENGSQGLLGNQLIFLSEYLKINFYEELKRVHEYERK